MSHRSRHRSVLRSIGAPLLTLCAACAATVRDPDAGEQVARAVGFEHAIELRAEGGALDVAPGAGPELALADALHRALEHDALLQSSLAQVRVALADAQQARVLPNPLLSFVLRFPEGGATPLIEAGVSQELAAMLKRPRAVSAADQRLRAAVASAVATALDVVAGLRESYIKVQALDELLPLFFERRALLDRLTELAQARVEFGEAARVDVTTLQAQRVGLEVEIADLELQRRGARLELARRIAEPSGTALWTLDARAELPDADADEGAWIRAALARRPEIQARVLELGALGDESALAELALWDGAAFGFAAERDGDWSSGPSLAVPIPLFDFGEARRARAAASIVAARHELVALSRQMIADVRGALGAFAAARNNLRRVRDELIPLQRQRREEVEAIYLAGQADITALLLAEQELQATQAKLVELEERAATSLIRLERAAGGPAVARDIRAIHDAIDSESRP